jgi:hypothetical protein
MISRVAPPSVLTLRRGVEIRESHPSLGVDGRVRPSVSFRPFNEPMTCALSPINNVLSGFCLILSQPIR